MFGITIKNNKIQQLVKYASSGSGEQCRNTMKADIIRDGDDVIVKMHDESGMMLKVTRKGDHKIGRSRLNVKSIIGAPYGSVFEIIGRNLVRLTDETILDKSLEESSGDNNGIVDNRSYVDSNTAQKLKDVDIHKFKESGCSGVEIIKSLIANSDTFNSKTEFAQAKWLKRKQKKYLRRLRVIKSSPVSLCESYHKKSNSKICNIRTDTLAQILSFANIYAGQRVIVIESVIGLVASAISYRMRGHGQILALYAGQQPHLDLIDRLNFNESDTRIIKTIPLTELKAASKYTQNYGFLEIDENNYNQHTNSSSKETQDVDMTDKVIITSATTTTNSDVNQLADQNENNELTVNCSLVQVQPQVQGHTTHSDDDSKNETNEEDKVDGENEDDLMEQIPSTVSSFASQKPHHASGRHLEELQQSRRLLRSGSNSLVIATRYRPLPILIHSLPLLAPGSSFVIFCEYREPLQECYLYLFQRSLAIRLQFTETWMREYQTLPGRVHPEMFMPSSGGFLLSGIYIHISKCIQDRYYSTATTTTSTMESTETSSEIVEDVTLPLDNNRYNNNNNNEDQVQQPHKKIKLG